jgi:trimeric autotransporter adhesin
MMSISRSLNACRSARLLAATALSLNSHLARWLDSNQFAITAQPLKTKLSQTQTMSAMRNVHRAGSSQHRNEPYEGANAGSATPASLLGRVGSYLLGAVWSRAPNSNATATATATATANSERRAYDARLASSGASADSAAAARFADAVAARRVAAHDSSSSSSSSSSSFAYPQTPSTAASASVADSTPLGQKRTRDQLTTGADASSMAPPVARVLDSTASLPATFEFDATPSKRRHVPAAGGATSSATASRSVHDILSALDKLTSPLVDAARSPRVPLTPAADVPERRPAPLSQSKAFALDLSSSGGNRLGLSAADDDDGDDENGTYDENLQSPQRELKSASDADAPPTATIDVRSGGMPTDVPTRSTSAAGATTTPARSTFAPQSGLRLPPTVLAARWANERAAAIAAAAPETRAAETSAQRAASGNATPAPLNNAAAYARIRESPLLASPPVVNSRASPRAAQPPAAVVARDAAALSSANESVCDGERLTARIHDALKSGAVGGMRDGWLLSLTMLEKSLRKDSLLLDSIVTEALVEARNETADGVAKLLADIGKLTERVTALPASIGAGSIVSAAAVPSAAPPTDVFKVPQQVFKPAKGKSDEGAAAAAATPATTPALSQAAAFLTDVASDAAAAAATSAAVSAVAATTQPLAPKKVRFEIGGDDDKTELDGAQQATPVADKTPMFGFPKTPTAGADNSGNSSKADEPAKTDKPLFSFGAPKTTPASSDDAVAKPSKPPLFEFGAAKKDGADAAKADGAGTPTSKPAFMFGAATPAGASAASGDGSDKKKHSTDSTQPKFGILSTPSSAGEAAAGATTVAAKPIFEFGKSASTPAAATSSDGSTPEATGAIKKPVFQFGAAAAKTDAAATPSTGGAFQFGAATTATTAPTTTTTTTTTEPAKVGAKPFMFGAASATPAAAAATPTTGAATPFQFGSSGGTPAFGFAAASGAATKPAPAFGFAAASGAATKPAFGGGGGGGVSFGFGAAAASATPAATGNAPFQFGAASSTPAAAAATTPAFQFGGAKPTPAAANPFGGGSTPEATGAIKKPPVLQFAAGFGAAATSSGGDDGGGDEDPNSPFAFRPTQGRKRVVARRKK